MISVSMALARSVVDKNGLSAALTPPVAVRLMRCSAASARPGTARNASIAEAHAPEFSGRLRDDEDIAATQHGDGTSLLPRAKCLAAL